MMPLKFQKIIDKLLHKTQSTFAFIDDILIVTKGTKEQHMDEIEEVLKTLEKARIRLKLEKCKIAPTKTELLGYKLATNALGRQVTSISIYSYALTR